MHIHRAEDARYSNASCADFGTLEIMLPHGDACRAGSGGSDYLAPEREANEEMKPITVGCSPIGHMLHDAGVEKLDL